MRKYLILLSLIISFCFGQYSNEWSSGNLGSYGWASANINVDNDGISELAVGGNGSLTFYNGDYSICWSIPFSDFTYIYSAIPRDINGDGLIVPTNTDNDASGELVVYGYRLNTSYQYEGKIKMYDATTRNLEWESPLISGLYNGYIEDIDGDNKAEIIINRTLNSNYYVDVNAHTSSGIYNNGQYTQNFSVEITQNPMPLSSFGNGQIELYDLLGRIRSGQDLFPGIYFLDNNGKYIKIIIE